MFLRAAYRCPLLVRAPLRSYSTELKSDLHLATEVKRSVRTPEIVALADKILALNMLEVVDLQNLLAERTGVNLAEARAFAASPAPAAAAVGAGAAGPAPAAAAAAAAAPAAAEAPAAAKKDTFKMKLVALEEGKKFPVLKILRKVAPGMNLMDSKKLVEELPSVILENAPAADAHKWVAELKEAGATVELS